MMRDCPKCASSQIEEGYQLDKGYGETHVGAWIRGTPDKKWYGYKVAKADRLPITQYRCKRCGYLESYAKG